jgi:D-alanyl-D-alanine carboxypeptidase
VMPCGSVGKTFVAALALDLEKRGEIDLDHTLDFWLGDEPWFPRLANGRTATLRMLLNHSGGIPDHRTSEGFLAGVGGALKTIDTKPDFLIPPRELVSYVLDTPASFEAGKGWSYSETGYILAGIILEKSSGRKVFDLEQERLLTPLGLEGVRPALTRRTARLANGYIAHTPAPFPPKSVVDGALLFNPASEFTGGGLYCSSGDLVRWVSALYEGRALRGDYVGELLTGVPTPAPEIRWGLGAEIATLDGRTLLGHGGEFPGYKTTVFYEPASRSAFAGQINTDAEGQTLGDFHALLKGFIGPPKR